ncbi:MAG: Omp28-related outer membrane protein [Bacteroidales bacterium]
MKRFLLSILSLIVSTAVFAQLPVDSTIQNKKVVLEEFTGINCPYCPDGHRIANDVMTANAGDFFIINIHTGSYADPGNNDPDYRTSYGPSLAAQANVSGFPAGTVNRHLFPSWSQSSGTAMSRGHWGNATNQILAETSYANIAMDAQINLQTKQMTVDVQIYFTDTVAPSTVNLNLAVNQNNIPGPQAGGATYNPSQMLPNGDYNHMHMLRELITGQWGDVIDTTAMGTLIQRQYTYSIPNDINGVPMEMPNLEVIGFIAEGQQEIITAAKADISYITPPGIDIADLEVKPVSDMPGLCDYSLDPEIMVINHGSVAVDTFRVSYDLNGNIDTVEQITNPIPAGDSVTITFPSITLPEGRNILTVNANVDSTAHLIEIENSDNTAKMPAIYTIPPSTFSSDLWENLESYSPFEEQLDNSIMMGPKEKAFVINQTKVTGLSHPIGGYGNSENSLLFFFYQMEQGTSSKLCWEKMDFSNNSNTRFRMDYAYAQYTNQNDKLEVQVSSDCGDTWTTVFEKAGANLATAPPLNSGMFFPDATQWKSDTIDLSLMDGESEVLLAIKGSSDKGNNLFVDNLVVYDDNTISIKENNIMEQFSVYPNPATDLINVDLSLNEPAEITLQVINSMGEVVMVQPEGSMPSGPHSIDINTSSLASGVYSLRIISGDKRSIKRFSIVR